MKKTPRPRSVAFIASAVVLVAVLLSPVASAQTQSDVEVRDQLIANQENLLNTYRCLFDTDAELVPGGCSNPDEIEPGPAPANPTQNDIDVRDGLIQNQEALLNVYRCQFDVDTELVPDGCPDDNAIPASLGPVPPLAEPWAELQRLKGLQDDCGYRTGRYLQCEYANGRLNLVDIVKISRGYSELYGCDTLYEIGVCYFFPNPSADIWEKRIELAEYQEACGYGRRRFGFHYWECSNDPLDASAPARPEHNAEVVRLGQEAYKCTFLLRTDMFCRRFGDYTSEQAEDCDFCRTLPAPQIRRQLQIIDKLLCQGWYFGEVSINPYEAYCYHPDHPNVAWRR